MPYVPTRRPPSAQAIKAVARLERRAALEDAGRYVQAKAAIYPPKPAGSSYNRTGTLGRSITVSTVTELGDSSFVEVGTNKHYARYVEYGTGIYRETAIGVSAGGDVIRPKTARALAWRSQGKQMGPGGKLIASGLRRSRGKLVPAAGRNEYMNFAAYVRGMHPWHFMERAFVDPATEAYFKARCEQMLARIAARMSET